MVKVRYSEGAAIHTDPESCAGHCREAVREALIGGRIGEVLSGESNVVRGADAVVACRRQQARVRQLGTANVIGGQFNDLTNVTGNLTLAGTLNVTNSNNFALGAYRLINYGGGFNVVG